MKHTTPYLARLIGLMMFLIPTTLHPAMAQQNADTTAIDISEEIFGPQRPVDLAYGAFQRGYYITALSLALERAEKNDAAAQTLIATIYANGLGVAQNMALAASWYDIASKNGDASATFELALLYQNGVGLPKNRQLAAEMFKKAADQGHREAIYNLALLHVEGIYAEPNIVLALELMEKAAEAGLSEAQYDYGIMLIQGVGTAPNPSRGAQYIGLAAQSGLLDAQVEYATLLYLGKVIERDREQAFLWYELAANGGSAVAQNRLAKLLAVGEGTNLDLQTAAMWRALAQRQGLNDPQLDSLLVSIAPEDLAMAQKRARYWPADPPVETPGISNLPQRILPDAPDTSLPTNMDEQTSRFQSDLPETPAHPAAQ
ncbi:MAG TPA: sel1 repeat family protein [Devosia sp.]|nr:sel1 repeat family protein [Devosia sp.]